ncbi:HAD-IA family hydrolase [Priestia filamentosa]|uniref:HAD-IA family hydrolase n=1 Tax=Priestia filamentosa TaxID=1402861 RepID=UPI00397B5163
MKILADFDGTLVNSYPNIVNNIYSQISEERKHIISEEEVYQLAKVNAKLAMDMLEFNDEQRKNVYHSQFKVIPELNKPFAHIENVLRYSELNVIMTHKSEKAVREILEYYQMSHYFKEIVTKDSGFPKKPHPASYKYLHDKYHIDLVIGDRQIDLLPGKELGITTCSYQNHLPAADYYIDDYSNFPLVVLGMKYKVKSHSKKRPDLSPEWLSEHFSMNSNEYKDIMELVHKSSDKNLAYLYKVGSSNRIRRSGNMYIDSALYAMEHGFEASIVKTIILQGLKNATAEEAKEVYNLFQQFLTDYVEDKVKEFSKIL